MMENLALRRLKSIAGHLQPSETLTGDLFLNRNPVSSSEKIDDASSPIIIGGMVLDINAVPNAHPVPGTTTPGKVQYVSGGVARNVAECMSKLGTRPFIISVVGLDMAGELLLKYWKSAGLSTEGILKLQGIATPVVSNVYDCSGELAAAVASVEAVETFVTPQWIKKFSHKIRSAPMVMVDANLNPLALKAACQLAGEFSIPLWFEPVSITKSVRISSIINYITFASPNVNELISMANALSLNKKFDFITKSFQSIETLFQMLKPAICVLLEKGVKVLSVTLGSYGVFLCCTGGPDFINEALNRRTASCSSRKLYELVNNNSLANRFHCNTETGMKSSSFAYHFPSLPASVVSLTGAGDCLVGGILASICAGIDLMQSIAVGITVAKAAVEAESNVPAKYSLTTIKGLLCLQMKQ
ncbi:Ribokinase protein [Dioscorea alata]|uniref:Ribokinase protein n=1 Tax=Dioscorea alata TaxID=55571 RepID=A0ACB7U0P9_DIOAL|nr:Ribokinase protein [Dioscorea alata]